MYAAAPGYAARLSPQPGVTALCPLCHQPVRAKCGSIVTWHWAHVEAEDCDPWAEPSSAWHLGWQAFVPEERREVVLTPHRADILTPRGVVVELQHSHIPEDVIKARQEFYRQMLWIFDETASYAAGRIDIRQRGGYVSFRWKHPRKSLRACDPDTFPVLLDLGDSRLLYLKKLHLEEAPYGGWGYIRPKGAVIAWLNR